MKRTASDLSMRVLLVTHEPEPGSMVSALARTLRAAGMDARILAPCGPGINRTPLYRHPEPVPVELGTREHFVAILTASHRDDSSVPVYLVDHQDFFARSHDDGDDPHTRIERAAFLSATAYAACRALYWTPHVMHAFGWQTSGVPVWGRTRERRRGFSETGMVLTTTDDTEPSGDAMVLARLGVRVEQAIAMGIYSDDGVSLLKAGQAHADACLSSEETVSTRPGQWKKRYLSISDSLIRRDSLSMR